MQPYERKQLLERIEREGATVGAAIPERLRLDSEEVPLRSWVFEVRADESGVDPPIPEMKRRLRSARRQKLELLQDDEAVAEVSWDRGVELVEEIVGIDRALNAIAESDSDIEAEMQARELADRRRWRNFLERALGRDDEPQGARRR